MSILIDRNEPPDFEFILNQMGIVTSVGSYNKTEENGTSFPDFLVLNNRVCGVSRKQAAEMMADLDAVESQLRRELRDVEKLCLMFEGFVTYHEDGVYAGNADPTRVVHHIGRKGAEYDVLTSRGKVFHQPMARWVRFIWKLEDIGIPVVPTGSVQGSAIFLAKLHEGHRNDLFERLIPARQRIVEENVQLRIWKQFLLGIPGIGPEAAVAIGDVFPNMVQLVAFLTEGGKLADLTVASGRRLGPALEKRIRLFLGVLA